MQASLSAFRFNRSAMFYLGLFALLAFMMLAPHPAFASEGTGGSLPYQAVEKPRKFHANGIICLSNSTR